MDETHSNPRRLSSSWRIFGWWVDVVHAGLIDAMDHRTDWVTDEWPQGGKNINK